VGDTTITVRTRNALDVLRSTRPGPIVLKLDVEGYEGVLLRNLLLSGVLCARVTTLFAEWHSLYPQDAGSMPLETLGVYRWMLQTYNPNYTQLDRGWFPRGDSTCNTTLLGWA
jgi:hypothetical protein